MAELLTDKYWMSEFNFLDEVRSQFDLPSNNRVYIHDVTLREAEQAPDIVFKPDEKIAIAKSLSDAGVHSIELFPIVSKDDAMLVKEIIGMNLSPKMICLARYLREDIDLVLECDGKETIIENVVNPWTCKVTWDMSEDDIVNKFVDAVKYAKSNGLTVSVMPWDAFRAPLVFLERLYKSVVYDGGADRVVISDTSGVGLPWTTAHIIKMLRSWVPEVPIEMHAHNEMGLASTAMISAVAGGASYVHTSMIGLGSRAGNAATEEVVLALELLMQIDTGVKLEKLYPTAKLVAELAKVQIPKDKSIIGDNLFTYEAGLSVFMFEKVSAAGRPFAYVPFMPELVGRPKHQFVLGKMSGKTSIEYKIDELGLELDKSKIGRLVQEVKRESILRKKSLDDEVFIDLVKKLQAE